MLKDILPIDIKRSLISNRDLGYTLYQAVAEVADNAIQASSEYFYFDTITKGKTVESLIFSDNGVGMDAETTLHTYLMQGCSSNWLGDTGIGKYGKGAKLAAFCHCKRITAYSRIKGTDDYYVTYYDLDEVMESDDVVKIKPPKKATLPSEVAEKAPQDANTIIVWSKLDRWNKKRSYNMTISDLKHDLGRTFRKFLYAGYEMYVCGKKVEYFDPTLQLKGSYNDKILTTALKGEGVKPHHYEPHYYCERYILGEKDGQQATLTVTLAPKEIIRGRSMSGDSLGRALKLRANQGKITYLRSGREVEYSTSTEIFGRGSQPQDRFVGIEVSFSPKFDDDFGVRTIKRGLELSDEMTKRIHEVVKPLLAQSTTTIQKYWKSYDNEEVDFETAENMVESLESFLNLTHATFGDQDKSQEAAARAEKLLFLAQELGEKDVDEFVQRKVNRPFIIVESEFDYGDHLLDFDFDGEQIVIRINKLHEVYNAVWLPMSKISQMSISELELLDPASTAKHALQSLNLMLFSFAKFQQKNKIENFEQVMNGWATELQTLLKQIQAYK